MGNLLRFEFRKLFHARVLYICAGVLILLVLLFTGVDKLTGDAMGAIGISSDMIVEEDMPEELSNIMGFGFLHNSGLSRMLTSMSNIYIIVVFGAFIAVFVCGDFGNAVIKNIITKGYSRTEVFFAKYIVTLIVSLCYEVLVFIVGFLLGTAFWNVGSGWDAVVISLLALQLLAVAAFNAFFCFLAAWLKRVGTTLALAIAIPIALPTIMSIIDMMLHEKDISISGYWLSGCLESASKVSASVRELALCFVVSVVYMAVFTLFGWLFARRREV